MAISPLELKEFIETTIPSYLGTYNYPGGTIPAIALLPHPQLGYYFPPADWSITGLEVVMIEILVSPANSQQRMGGDLAIWYGWQIFVKQHDLSGHLHEAMDILMTEISQRYHILKGFGGYTPPDKEGLVIATGKIVIVDPVVKANL